MIESEYHTIWTTLDRTKPTGENNRFATLVPYEYDIHILGDSPQRTEIPEHAWDMGHALASNSLWVLSPTPLPEIVLKILSNVHGLALFRMVYPKIDIDLKKTDLVIAETPYDTNRYLVFRARPTYSDEGNLIMKYTMFWRERRGSSEEIIGDYLTAKELCDLLTLIFV